MDSIRKDNDEENMSEDTEGFDAEETRDAENEALSPQTRYLILISAFACIESILLTNELNSWPKVIGHEQSSFFDITVCDPLPASFQVKRKIP